MIDTIETFLEVYEHVNWTFFIVKYISYFLGHF